MRITLLVPEAASCVQKPNPNYDEAHVVRAELCEKTAPQNQEIQDGSQPNQRLFQVEFTCQKIRELGKKKRIAIGANPTVFRTSRS